jgi:hypothetical protein
MPNFLRVDLQARQKAPQSDIWIFIRLKKTQLMRKSINRLIQPYIS